MLSSSLLSTAKGEYRLLLLLECTDGDGGGVNVTVRSGGTGSHGMVSESNDDSSPSEDVIEVFVLLGS
jgi:hypothetical protein